MKEVSADRTRAKKGRQLASLVFSLCTTCDNSEGIRKKIMGFPCLLIKLYLIGYVFYYIGGKFICLYNELQIVASTYR